MSFGAGHWWLILLVLVVVLIVWGPGKLPDLGAGMGRAIKEFRRATSDAKGEVVDAATKEPAPSAQAAPAKTEEAKPSEPVGTPAGDGKQGA